MKQLGNLAIVCANRPDVLMQLYKGKVSVHFGTGPCRDSLIAKWDDDTAITKLIYELNYGKYADKRKGNQAA